MSNEFNDVILEDLAEEIQSKNPTISDKEMQIRLLQAFESLPEPDFKGGDIDDR